MKNIIFLIVVLVLANNYHIISQDILWKKNFGQSSADDFGQSVIEANDGNIVLVGYTASFGAGGNDIWLIKTTPDGDTIWTKTYGESGDDFGYQLRQTEDNGFIIAGATQSFGSAGGLDFCLIKTDEDGNQLWVKTFGFQNDDMGYSLELTMDGGYILAGEKDAYPEADSDVWIVKTDSIGQMQWEKSYGIETEDERAYTIKQTADGGYILGGQKGCSGFSSCDAWLLKLNSLGDTLWTKKFVTPSWSSSFHSIIEVNNSEYVMTGLHWVTGEYWDVWLLKTDSLGNEIWSRTYDYQNDYDIGYSVQQTIDGGYIVCGSAIVDGGASFGWIIRTNDLGDTLWTQEVHSYVKSSVLSSINTTLYSVIQSSNGDYVVVGNQPILPVSDHAQQVVLLRIASDIIPVELTSFTASVMQNSVSLNWQTATETNNSGFEIERSEMSNVKGQTDWQVVGFIPGFGTTTEPKSYSFIDENLSAGKYKYRLKQIDFDGSFEYFPNAFGIEVVITSPTEFSLEQNYPNPFNPSTNIKYTISSRQFVTLKIFNSLGEEIETLVNEFQDAGVHSKLYIVNSTLPSGVYYYQLKSGNFLDTKKMVLLR